MQYRPLFLALSLALPLWAQAQQPPFEMGLPSEPDKAYEKMNVKATLTEANYRNVGGKASVKDYAPLPQSQGQFGTCAAWAAGYAARTILEARRYGWTDRNEITKNAFSYGYLYRMNSSASNCWGAYLTDCVDHMQNTGIPKLSDYAIHCPNTPIPEAVKETAKKYKIKGSVKLWDEFTGTTNKRKIELLKKSLSEGNPVVIAMIVPNSFYYPKAGLWAPLATERANGTYTHNHGRHAMCVVGYDDEKFGGAFEIQNSWGANWGDKGYVWVRYEDFANFVYQAIELINFEAVDKNQDVNLQGALRLQLDTRQEMRPLLQANNTYKIDRAYRSGTRFRIYISNNEPAFVYAIGSDLTAQTYQVFPYAPNVSAALTYKQNDVPIPSESKHIRMDNKVGTDFLCILYSKEALDIEDIRRKIGQQSNRLTFQQKVETVLGNKLMKGTEIQFERSRMAFKAKGKGKSVAMLMVEIEHIE